MCGSILINLGTNVMKLGLLRAAKRRNRALERDLPVHTDDSRMRLSCLHGSWVWTLGTCDCDFRRYLLSKTWLMGFTAFVAGNFFNFFSFSFAAQSLLASLGAVQFITNVIFARLVLKETLNWRTLGGTLLIVAGVALVVKFSCHDNPAVNYSLHELMELFVDQGFLVYVGVLVVLLCVSQYVLMRSQDKNHRTHSRIEGLSYAAVSAIIGAQAVTFFKILSELISIVANVAPSDDVTANAVYSSPFTYAIAVLAMCASFFWVQRLNFALRYYDALFIVPVFQVMWVTLSVIGGGILFHEFEQCLKGTTALVFVLGLCTIFAGVFVLSPQASTPTQVSPLAFAPESTMPLLGGADGMTPVSSHALLQSHPSASLQSSRPTVTPFASPALTSLPRPSDSFADDLNEHGGNELGDRSLSLLQLGVFPVLAGPEDINQNLSRRASEGSAGTARASTM